MSWAAVATVGGSIIGGMILGDATESAAQIQGDSANAAIRQQQIAIEEERRQYDLSRGDLAPYREAGAAGLSTISDLIGAGRPLTSAERGSYAQDVPFNGPAGLPEDAALPSFEYGGTPYNYPRTAMQGQPQGAQAMRSNTLAGLTGGGQDAGTQGGMEPGTTVAYRGAAGQPVYQYPDGTFGYESGARPQAQSAVPNGQNPITVDQQGNLLPAEAAPGVENFDAPKFDFNFQTDPGYQFRLAEGTNAIQNSAAGRTGILSGNTLRGIMDYGQNLASDEYGKAYGRARGEYSENYGNAWDRYLNSLDLERQRYGRAVDQYGRALNESNTQTGRNWNRYGQQYAAATDTYNRGVTGRQNRLNTLQSLAGIGQQATNQSATLGANYAGQVSQGAQNIGNIGMNAANVQGAAGIAGANAISGGLSGASNYFTQQNTLNRLLSNQNSGYTNGVNYSETWPIYGAGNAQ